MANLIGVVTVTYNSGSVLPDFLDCVAAQTHREFLLFAVDNASRDDTLANLRQWTDPRLRVIANSDNRGVAAGNNQGIAAALAAGCDSVLLVNNDAEFGDSLFAQLLAELDNGVAKMVCPKMMYFEEPARIWAAGGAFQPWLGYRSVHLGANEIDNGQHNQKKLLTYVPTCCVLINKHVFEAIGLMDEQYFVYLDDVDFMYRATKAGIKLMYVPEAKLLHKVGRLTGGDDSPFTVRYTARNRMYFMLKHSGFVRTIPMALFYQTYYLAGLLFGTLYT